MAENCKSVPIQSLLDKKEKEWKELQELRAQSLEEAAKIKEKQLQEERLKFKTLKDDFKYNLMLLKERDQELNKTEVLLHKVKSALSEKVSEISSLKIEIDEMKTTVAMETKAREDLQASYQKRLKSREQDFMRSKIAKESEVKKERDNIDEYKRNLQRQLQEVEEELGIQKQELTSEMEDVLKKREREYRKTMDEASSKLLAYEMKVKLLSRELELVRQENEKSSSTLQDADTQAREAEKKLKQKEWELEDLKGMKNARISELESELQLKEIAVKRALEDYQRRHAELDRFAREKEATISAIKSSQNEMEQSLKDQLRENQAQVEALQVEKRRMEWSSTDAIQEKDRIINGLQTELSDAKEHSDHHLAKISKEVVTKDLEIQSLKEVQDAIRGELAQRKEDVERYKKELSLTLEREASLERSKTQLELDWQRRCEAAERNQYASSEELVERLSKARQESEAIIKEQDRELAQKNDLIRAITRQRNQVIATLNKYGIAVQHNHVIDKEINLEEESLDNLRQQNEMLRNAISDMRQEMERFSQQQPINSNVKEGGLSPANDGPLSEEYVKMIEKECRELKMKNRELSDNLHLIGSSKTKVEEGIVPPSSDNLYIRRHVQSLNDIIGTLRTEKVGLNAQLKKQQIRIASLESRLSQISQQPSTMRAQVDQLQYEISTQIRRHTTEVSSFKQRIADLELELAETRREADEYYKGGLQTNLEAMALGNQVSALKMDIAAKPQMNSHQSSFISELQREVNQLRAQLASRISSKGPIGDHLLQEKLKSAAKHIQQLAKERQQLIEMGNKLRAELNKHQPSRDTAEYGQPKASIKQMKEGFQKKLGDVEQLQYQLTMKELQYANRGVQRDEEHAKVVQVELSSSSASTSTQEDEDDMGHSSVLIPDRLTSDQLQQEYISMATENQSKQKDLEGNLTMSSRGDGQTPLHMSTFGEESLKDVWRLLDDGMGFMRSTTPTVQEESRQFTHHAPEHLGIHGKRIYHEQKPFAEKKALPNRTAGKVQQKPNKIRNYNIKDI